MEGQVPDHRTRAFLVRVYIEPREIPGAIPRMAAWVQDVSSGEGRYVRTMSEVEGFIRDALRAAGMPTLDWWSS